MSTTAVTGIVNRSKGQIKPLDLENDAPAANDKAYHITQFLLKMMQTDSPFFQKNPNVSLPAFKASDISLEENLGQGECGTVFSIGAIRPSTRRKEAATQNHSSTFAVDRAIAITEGNLYDDESKMEDNSFPSLQVNKISVHRIQSDCDLKGLNNNKTTTSLSLWCEEVESKDYMSTHVTREDDDKPRYAVKQLRRDLTGNKLVQATADLASEASFLRSLRGISHPNICKIRATIGEPGTPNFGIVMDRMNMNLREKMRDWKKYEERRFRLFKKVVLHHHQPSQEEQLQVQGQIYGEKLMALYDIARALQHLADNRIIFRDLKPENVGVDVRGDMRLFDFGLAKELKDKDMTGPGMYKLTGMTGCRRYMAPEVIQSKDYGLSADVYSFAIVAWEVMSNCTAYSFVSYEKLFETVVQKRKRPDLKKMIAKKKHVLPEGSHICDLVSLCWCHDARDRLSMKQVCDLIQAEFMLYTGGDDESCSSTLAG